MAFRGAAGPIWRDAVCEAPQQRGVWFVNTSRREYLEANESDSRCLRLPGLTWIKEIASVYKSHLRKHGEALSRTERRCRWCSKIVGRRLPPTCMRRLISDNMERIDVPCVCLAAEAEAQRPNLLLIEWALRPARP